MNRLIIFLVLGTSVAVAQDQTAATDKKQTTPKAKPAATAAPPNTIPKDAVANADGSYSYTDEAGKKWTYNKTPFGISRMEVAAAAPATGSTEPTVKTTDLGDTVQFEKATPFGIMKTKKKKSEMTDEERALYQSQHPDTHK